MAAAGTLCAADPWPALERCLAHLPEREQGGVGRACMRASAHATSVATMLAGFGADADILIAALLNFGGRPLAAEESLRKDFGKDAARAAVALSGLTEHGQSAEHHAGERLRTLVGVLKKDVRLVVALLCERLHAMRDLRCRPKHEWMPFAQETLDFHARVADRICMQDLRDDLEGLCFRFLDPALYKTLREQREQAALAAREDVLPEMEELLRSSALPCAFAHEHIPWTELRSRRGAGGGTPMPPPPIAVACVCGDTESCYALLGMIHSAWRTEAHALRDCINSPRINGEQGLCTTIMRRDGSRVRCRIGTEDMHRYARTGVASVCFGAPLLGLMNYLPWMHQLPQDQRSLRSHTKEFWHVLEQEMLGRQIAIHGMDDRAIFISQSATALDAACFCYRERALWTEKILINNRPVSFSSPLCDGDTVMAVYAKHRTVERSWLQAAHTRLAAELVRDALASGSRSKNIVTGKHLLQTLMHERRRGFLEEFEETSFETALRSMGYASLDEACIAIAEGSLAAEHLHDAIFPPKKTLWSSVRVTWSVTGRFPAGDADVLRRAIEICRRHHAELCGVQWTESALGAGTISLRAFLTRPEQQSFVADLRSLGVTGIEADTSMALLRSAAAAAGVIVFWGLDPVLAKYLLVNVPELQPFDFSLLRSLGFFFFCLAFCIIDRLRSPRMTRSLPWKCAPLWIGGAALAATSLGTYFSLTELQPQQYMTVAFSAAITIPLMRASFQQSPRIEQLLPVAAIVLGVMTALARLHGGLLSAAALTGAFLLLIGFSVFTLSIDLFKSRYRIAARMPAALCVIAGIALAVHLMLAPMFTVTVGSISTIALGVGYGIVMTGVPYALYCSLVTTSGFRQTAQYFSVAALLTFAGQYIVFGTVHLPSIALLLLIGAATYALYRRRWYPVLPDGYGVAPAPA